MPTTANSTTSTLTELLTHLVRFPTITSDKATNQVAIDWIEEQLSGLPLHVHRYVSQGHPMLVATTRNTRSPKIWLAGHVDVVHDGPGGFKPVVRDGRLYGRGTHDMKAGIAVFIALLQELGDDLRDYDLGLMITSDEEIGGAHGVKWLLEQGYRGKVAFIPDSGASWKMEVGAKGVMWWEITATGRSAHASRTWDGVNAIEQLVRFVDHVRAHLPTEPCGDPGHQHTTLNFANITGGSATNQVPSNAVGRVDLRITPDVGLETVTSWFEDAKIAVPGVEAKAVLADAPYHVTDERPIALFRDITRSVTGAVPEATMAHGSSDARHFAAFRIPTINCSPTGSGFHVPNEWIDLEDLTRYYEITKQFVERWTLK